MGPHAHPGAANAVGDGLAAVLEDLEPGLDAAFLEGVVVIGFFQVVHDLVGVFVCPVRQDNHDVMIGFYRLAVLRVKHDGAIDAALFLQAGVRVVPVGAVMDDGVFVGERGARPDWRHGEVGDAILVLRQEYAVPVD